MAQLKFLGKLSTYVVLILSMATPLMANGVEDGTSYRSDIRIKLATTTSTDNSGLLADLLPVFTEMTGIAVDVIAVGTGKALALGQNGDVDVVLVHAPSREQIFVEAGYGVNHRSVMHNDFVILGPSDDPAGIKGSSDAVEALDAVAESQSLFVSRGDDSGTHTKERSLWADAGVDHGGNWYSEAGQGMGAVMTIASESGGYTLADRGTWLSMKDKLNLNVMTEGDSRLFNPYGVIAVNPALHDHVKYIESMIFIAWLTSAGGQKRIADFRINSEILFIPDAVPQK
jgi:tungstate transport system substrate-binding protein